jgi:hypothetical protein
MSDFDGKADIALACFGRAWSENVKPFATSILKGVGPDLGNPAQKPCAIGIGRFPTRGKLVGNS